MITIQTRQDLDTLLRQGNGPYYVYVLRHPNGFVSFNGIGTPFYVGIGQRGRLFEHEKATRDATEAGLKIDTIRSIWSRGQEVVRTIDSFHAAAPWIREAELIHEIGRLADGAGSLTNPQTYSASCLHDGVELRKYAAEQLAAGGVDAIPSSFKLRNTRLKAGPITPRSISKGSGKTCVMGKVYLTVHAHPGVTGEELVELLAAIDWRDNKSAYTQGGRVCASWLCGYIEGAFFRSDKMHLEEFEP